MNLPLAVALLCGLNIITPGASFVLTVQHSLAFGPRVGYGIALGLSIADIVLAFFAAVGFAAALGANDTAMTILGYAGGVWIASLGLTMFQKSRRTQVGGVQGDAPLVPSMTLFEGLRIGVITGMSNPQTIVFFASLFVSLLADQDTSSKIIPIFMVIATTSLCLRSGIAAMVSLDSVRRAYVSKKSLIEALSGALLFCFGTKMAAKALLPISLKLVALSTAGLTA